MSGTYRQIIVRAPGASVLIEIDEEGVHACWRVSQFDHWKPVDEAFVTDRVGPLPHRRDLDGPRPNLQALIDAAAAEHGRVVFHLTTLLEQLVAANTLAEWPDAVELHVHGEYGEDGLLKLRAQKVTSTDGQVLDGYVDDVSTSEKWDDFTDLVDSQLDWMAELTGDDWLHDQTIELSQPRETMAIKEGE